MKGNNKLYSMAIAEITEIWLGIHSVDMLAHAAEFLLSLRR
jgi:hypothetical protein